LINWYALPSSFWCYKTPGALGAGIHVRRADGRYWYPLSDIHFCSFRSKKQYNNTFLNTFLVTFITQKRYNSLYAR
jgi:hypothetical protein